MADLENIYEDQKNWVHFEGEDEGETISIYCRCECGQFLKRGKCYMNGLGEVILKGFICKKHGEVQPYYDREG